MKWSERNGIPVANLTDSDTQIDAILSRESLEEYKKDFPTSPLSKDGCRGYTIHLAGFELVYEYSTGKPKLHLYVKRFNIIWERGRIKQAPTGKSAGKKPALFTLIKRVFSSIKSQNRPRQGTVDTTEDSNGYSNGYSDIPAKQVTNGHTIDSTQPHLMSQLPTRRSTDHDLADPGKLLQQLEARAPGDEQPSRERSIDAGTLAPVAAPETNHRSAGHLPSGGNESSTSHEPQRTELEAERDGPQRSSDRPSPQDSAGEDIIRSNAEPYSPEAQLKAQLEASQHVTLRQPSFAKTASSSTVDPWEGMTGIRSIDVTVPKDQKELLEPDKKPWYPPQVGEPVVSGRVPPALLDEWNRLAFQRHQKEIDNKPESMEVDHLIAPSTPAAETSSDSSSDCEWSATPGRTPRRGALLPVDSSPLKDSSAHHERPRRSSSSDQGGPTEVREEESQLEEKEMQAPPINQSPSAESPPIQAEVENNGPSAEASAADMTHDNDHGHESDSSSDSEMSVSVPQPLSGSTQQGTSSQVEPGVSSSGPSLPESAGQNVQVMETPAAAFNKARPAAYNQDGFQTGLGYMVIQSQADKSSSQSRVLNTYASRDESTKGETSQESSKSLPPSGPDAQNPVLVIGTRFSSEAPTTQQTRWSGSSSLFTSSGRKIVEGSVATASLHHSQSSRAFSSYRDLPPSSMLSIEDDNRSSSVHSSVRGTPLKIDRATRMKRFASEMGDSDRGSPSKRNQFDSKPTALELEGGLDARIISRRESYIINSEQSVEAARVYEKFQNDYPIYKGDFEHFTKLCSRLQAVRESGSLQRSFLWDDFIIKHLLGYPAYLEDCLGNKSNFINYEEYFVSSFSTPTYKKRSLTVEGINACAAQYIKIDERRSSSRPATGTGTAANTKTSFTESLRDQFSNFHAHSFVETRDLSTDDRQSEDNQSETGSEWNLSQYSIPDSEPARAAAAAQKDSNEDMNLEHISPKPTTAPVTYDHEHSSEDEYEDEDEDMEQVNNAAHETASVELGDSNNSQDQAEAKALEAPPNTAPEIPASDAASNADADVESSHEFPLEKPFNENWFDSLRHIFPDEPVWSDDHNTPFKKWALADQNVMSVRNRRGGARVDTDEKGIIRRFPRA